MHINNIHMTRWLLWSKMGVVWQGRRQGGRVRERPLLGKIFEIYRENLLHRKKSLKFTLKIRDFEKTTVSKSWRHPWLSILRGCNEWMNYWCVQNPGDTPDWLFWGVVMNELLVHKKSWRHSWLTILRGCNEWITGAYKVLATPLIDYFEGL
jgi:hypothetical protein